jgi:hypothetical protein
LAFENKIRRKKRKIMATHSVTHSASPDGWSLCGTLRLLALLLLGSTAVAQTSAWELKRDLEGIKVFTRSVDGSPFKEVRSESTITGVTLNSLVALIEDAQACPNWADKCAQSYLVERTSATQSLVYTHNDMPFPVSDRDVVAKVIWQQDPQSLNVKMTSTAVSGGVEPQRGRLRLTNANAMWQFSPNPNGSISVVIQAHIDPGSSIPGWVTNMLLVDTPFETMKSYLAEVLKPKYQAANIAFVTEPASSN